MKKIETTLKIPDMLNIILERLRPELDNQAEFYLVGGCVRDSLIGVEPKDWDLVTNLNPDEIIIALEKAFKDGIYEHKVLVNTDNSRFGVIRIIITSNDNENRYEYEIVTFRGDGEYLDNRRPDSVFFSTIDVDAQRRDFTMNALYYNPYKRVIYDFHDGVEDIKRGIIKCVGNPLKRFGEDRLRILRAIRFAVKYDMVLESSLKIVIDYMLEYRMIFEGVSYERQLEEFKKIAKYLPYYTKNEFDFKKILQQYLEQYKIDENNYIQLPSENLSNLNQLLGVAMLFFKDLRDYLVHLKFSKSDIEEISFFNDVIRNRLTYDVFTKHKKYIDSRDKDDIKLNLLQIRNYTIHDIVPSIKGIYFVLENRTDYFIEKGYEGSELGKVLWLDGHGQYENFLNNG